MDPTKNVENCDLEQLILTGAREAALFTMIRDVDIKWDKAACSTCDTSAVLCFLTCELLEKKNSTKNVA